MGSRQIRMEMTELDIALENLIGVKLSYMRPPYGSLSTTAETTLVSMGYNIVLWSVDTNDWRHPDDINESLIPIREAINSGDEQGPVILMHDTIEKTVTELTPQAIDLIRSNGFKMVTVGECLGKPENEWYRN
ncbi:chitin deacetylase [Linnemannia gamsii]|uniref:Chitin deacetylase n=1 Tax=Linnemannia gamsii TaxID=64522 RepID=A0ABQ7JPS4_9FUNG|nr:chitin deacetylase [Linnemannia gamsii]